MNMQALRMLANVVRWLAIVALVAAGVFHVLAYAGVITADDCKAIATWLAWLVKPCVGAWYVSRTDSDLQAFGYALAAIVLAIVATLIIRDAGKLRLFRRYGRAPMAPRALAFDDAGTIDVRPVLHVTSAKPRKGKAKRTSEGTARRHAYRDPRTNRFVSRAAYMALVADGLAPRIV